MDTMCLDCRHRLDWVRVGLCNAESRCNKHVHSCSEALSQRAKQFFYAACALLLLPYKKVYGCRCRWIVLSVFNFSALLLMSEWGSRTGKDWDETSCIEKTRKKNIVRWELYPLQNSQNLSQTKMFEARSKFNWISTTAVAHRINASWKNSVCRRARFIVTSYNA